MPVAPLADAVPPLADIAGPSVPRALRARVRNASCEAGDLGEAESSTHVRRAFSQGTAVHQTLLA